MDDSVAPNGQQPVEEAPIQFLDGVNEENVTQEIWITINKLFSYISHLVNYKHHLLIYRLLKKKVVPPETLSEVCGYSRQRLYSIVNAFEKRETERLADKDEEG